MINKLIPILVFFSFYNAYSQFTIISPGGNNTIYTRGNVNIGTPTNTTNKLNVTGNSLFTGNTIVTGNSQIGYLGIGTTPNTQYRLLLNGNSFFNGNMGIGIAPSNNPSTKLIISSGTNGVTGLNFSNLNSNFTPTVSNNNKTLNVDLAGNVILSKTIDNITLNLSGNSLSTSINGVISNSINLPIPLANNFWGINGNNLNIGNEFIGTVSNHDLIFKSHNIFSGKLAINNTSIGYNSLTNVQPNYDYNTAFGVNNLIAPLSGNYNVALGSNNLQNNTSGHSNIAVGSYSLTNNTIGYQNIGLGYNALNHNINGNMNIAVGNFALQDNSTGNNNSAFGNQTLLKNTTGTLNSGFGNYSLFSNTIGTQNIAIGTNALYSNVSGNNNNATGFNSLANNISGNNNNAFGDHSLANLSNGNNNSAFGYSSLGTLLTGSNNVALGNNSGYNLNNGNNNIFIGNNIQPSTNNVDNSLIIGNKIYGTESAGDIKIGFGIISNPQANLHTNGTVRLQNLPFSTTIPTNILGADDVGNVYKFNPNLLLATSTTNNLVSNVNTMTSTVNGFSSSTPIINSISNSVTGDQLTTTINGISSAPISLPQDDLTTELIDNYIGLRLKPIDTNVNGFNLKKNTNTVIGYRAINPNTTGNAAAAAIGIGINDTDNYKDLTYICHFGPNYYVNKFASNGALLTDRNLFIGSYGISKYIDFVLGNDFTNTQSKFKIDNTSISSLSYPNLRNDISTSNPINFIYTDSSGKFLSAPLNFITSNLINNNIYNIDGNLTNSRTLNLNNNNLRFTTESFRTIFVSNPLNSNNNSALEIISSNEPIYPNLLGKGFFKIKQEKSELYLTQGINEQNAWIQSSKNPNNLTNKHVLSLNPLGGNVGIGVPNATAQLHTINSVRFENLPNNTNPIGILGTDANGNVFNYDPNQFGGGTSQDAWLLNGNIGTNPGTLSGQNFIGTIDNKDLVLGVNSDEKIRITQTGRIQLFGWTPSNGANSAYNIFIGGGNDNSALANVAIGVGSMIQNTSGKFNTSTGFSALENNLTGEGNTSYGFQSMRMNTTGSSNVSIGVNSMFNNTIGINNVSVGSSSLQENINGSNNVTIGTWAGLNLLNGNSNVLLGNASGSTLNSGTGNILIGDSTQTMTTSSSNELNIGNWIFGKNGQIAIGNFTNLPQSFITNNDYQLIVKRGIRTEKVRVDIASVKNWADYVFLKDYKLMPLSELENFIVKNGHLPNIPKAENVVKEGIDLGEINSKLLEKVEELTLYTIELNKNNQDLENKNNSQQKTIENLIKRLEKLEKNIKE